MSAIAPLDYQASFYSPVKGASAQPKQPWEQFVDLTNVRELHLRGERQKLDLIGGLPENWDGNGSAQPAPSAVALAKELLPPMYELVATTVHKWVTPHITASEAGEIVLEWWHGDRKLTIYVSNAGFQYIKVWGINIDHEMEAGELTSSHAFLAVWSWLYT